MYNASTQTKEKKMTVWIVYEQGYYSCQNVIIGVYASEEEAEKVAQEKDALVTDAEFFA